MKALGILVLVASALGWWVHDQRAKKPDAAAGRQVLAAGFQPYAPQIGQASRARKARVTGLRIITPAAEFANQVATPTLDQFIRRVEDQAGEVLAREKQGSVRIHFTTSPKDQSVQVQARDIDATALQALHQRLMALERLKVKSSDVVFELQLAVAP